ncbi:MAG: hypothetical protein A2189_04045 [Paenibacillus sp. RIFOXYA1_FULL_44_5]|nr:MAG: hypothetical protein A2189_04045 [Paenibacillus sp. RIFOXYA1_FULL_44_5]
MKLQDTLFNWLQMKIVSEARPEDQAAKDTMDFFAEILLEDHKISAIPLIEMDDRMVHLYFSIEGQDKEEVFFRESVEQLLTDINSNPKYNNEIL